MAGARFQVLEALLDKSLVGFADGRYTMLEAIRELALERGRADDLARARGRHAAWFGTFAEEAGARIRGPGQQEWLARIGAELANLRVAFARLLDTEPADALRTACALAPFWDAAGLGRGPAMAGRSARARAGGARARARADLGGPARLVSRRLVERLPPLPRGPRAPRGRSASPRGSRSVSSRLGWALAEATGDFAAATPLCEQAVAVARGLGDRRLLARTLDDAVGALTTDPDGDHALARSLGEEALLLWRELGDEQNITESSNNLGWTELVALAPTPRPRRCSTECFELAAALGDVRHEVRDRQPRPGRAAHGGRGDGRAALPGQPRPGAGRCAIGARPRRRCAGRPRSPPRAATPAAPGSSGAPPTRSTPAP